MLLAPEERKRVAVCLTTQYHGFEQDKAVNVRGKLAQTTIRESVKAGYTTIVVDGKSDALFLDGMKDVLPKTVFSVQIRDGFGNGRREALDMASLVPDLGAVVMTEPEKRDMTKRHLCDALAEPILRGEADITILNRTDSSFRTMSPYQAQSEQAANLIINDLLRAHKLLPGEIVDLDFLSGGRGIGPKALPLFRRMWTFRDNRDITFHHALKDNLLDIYANVLLFPVYQALKDGLRVMPVAADLRYPDEQTAVERTDPAFRKKRDWQRGTIVLQSIEFLRFLSEGHTRFRLP